MTRSRKIIVVVVATVVGAAGWCAYEFLYTWWHIPEAYAAWDTGTLLVEYMKRHDDRWPSSWDDLIAMYTESRGEILMRFGSDESGYVPSLQKMVSVDWNFDPARSDQANPVRRVDGTAFPIVWEIGEPNELVREYLKERLGNRQ